MLFVFGLGTASAAKHPLLDRVSTSVGSTPFGQLSMSGTWTSETSDGKIQPAVGSMQVEQRGLQFSGRSRDNYGVSIVKGRVFPPNQIAFSKQYVGASGEPVNQPLSYDGYLVREKDAGLVAKGQWVMRVPAGNARRSETITRRGLWSARLVGPSAFKAPAQVLPALPQQQHFSPEHVSRELEAKAGIQEQLVKLVIGIFVVAMFVLTLSISYFKPSGILDRATQRQYIPTQVQGQHQKLRAEWTRPLQSGGVPLGQRFEWRWWRPWGGKELNLPPAQRLKNPHMLVLGVGGKGKTRLVANMIAHDIVSNDRAVIVIDSNGELAELMSRWIAAQPDAKKLAKRTIIIDPVKENSVTGFNPLAKPDNGDLQAAASAVVHGFKSIYQENPGAPGQWNAQTAGILRNAALLLIVNGKTLVDLPTLLQDNDYRDLLLETVEKRRDERTEYGALLEAWTQYKKLARSEQWIDWVEPILNRIGPVLSDPRIRILMTEPENEVRFSDVIKERKIVIVKLSQSDFGQNANLFGSLIVTGIQQAALMIFNPQKQRPTALYLDEFDRFIEKETLKAITTETQTLQIGLIGVGKTLQRISEDFRSGIVITMGIINCFAISKKDADVLGPQMFRVDGRKERHQTIQDVVNRVNESPQFLLITDEEKLNIDRLAGQEVRNFFCYRVGSVAGVFQLRSHDFPDIDESKVDWALIERMRNRTKGEAVKSNELERATEGGTNGN